MPSKKVRARAKKAAAAQAPAPAPALTGGAGHDDLARSKKADMRAARRASRNYTAGTDAVGAMGDRRRRALTEAVTQGQAAFMGHHTGHRMQNLASGERLRRKLAARRGEEYDEEGMRLAEKVVMGRFCAVDGA